MWNWFTQFLFEVLKAITSVVGDWGLSIIVLTTIIRLVLTPLTVKSTRSSAKMQLLQPKLKALQERYADDPQAQSQAMREFYAENKFNPLGGCLPMLIQMPVFFGLYSVLRNMLPPEASLYNILGPLSESVGGAIAHLGITGAWLFIVLDVAFGILTLIPMYLNSKTSSAEQQQQMKIMGLVMSVMMLWVGWGIPVGVLLYYDTSAIWGVVQQIFITRKVTEKVKAEEAAKQAYAPIEVDVVRREVKPRPRKKK